VADRPARRIRHLRDVEEAVSAVYHKRQFLHAANELVKSSRPTAAHVLDLAAALTSVLEDMVGVKCEVRIVRIAVPPAPTERAALAECENCGDTGTAFGKKCACRS
jgi:hypothetical protein